MEKWLQQKKQVQKLGEGSRNSSCPRSSKRTRAAEIHNLSEKRRRSRINEKLKALQTLVPNSNKTDKASMLDEAIEYLKQHQLKVQTLTMRNGYCLPPVYSQDIDMQRGMGMGYNEGYKLPNPSEGAATFSQNEGFSMRRDFGMPNHIGMQPKIMKLNPVFGSEPANENQYGFTNHSTSMKVLLTPTHLAIVMEYAAGGEIFERICNAGKFTENEARFFFQQLISGVSYCHSMENCHIDLKLENTLLDGSTAPRVKICDFGYSKSSVLHSQPKSTVGTPAYIAPVLCKTESFCLEPLPNILQRKYALLRDLDKSLQATSADIQRENELHCLQEIDKFKEGVKTGKIAPGTSLNKFSDEAQDEQKHAIRIADEKVALAVQAYDLVDAHIQQLDQYLKKVEEHRREKENAAAAGSPALNADGNGKPVKEGGTGGRKKSRLAAAASTSTTATAKL